MANSQEVEKVVINFTYCTTYADRWPIICLLNCPLLLLVLSTFRRHSVICMPLCNFVCILWPNKSIHLKPARH